MSDVSVCVFQLEQMYKDAHAKIREDPSFTKKAPREDIKKKRCVRECFKQHCECVLN